MTHQMRVPNWFVQGTLSLKVAALRYELGEDHVYDFVEGSIPCDPAPGAPHSSSWTNLIPDQLNALAYQN